MNVRVLVIPDRAIVVSCWVTSTVWLVITLPKVPIVVVTQGMVSSSRQSKVI